MSHPLSASKPGKPVTLSQSSAPEPASNAASSHEAAPDAQSPCVHYSLHPGLTPAYHYLGSSPDGEVTPFSSARCDRAYRLSLPTELTGRTSSVSTLKCELSRSHHQSLPPHDIGDAEFSSRWN